MNWNEWKKRCVCVRFGVFAKSLLSEKIGVCIAIWACKRISVSSAHKAKCQPAHSTQNDIQRNRCSVDEIANINHKNQPQMRIKRVNYSLNNLFCQLAFERKHFFGISFLCMIFFSHSFPFHWFHLLPSYPSFATKLFVSISSFKLNIG